MTNIANMSFLGFRHQYSIVDGADNTSSESAHQHQQQAAPMESHGYSLDADESAIAATCEKAVSDAAKEYNGELKKLKTGGGGLANSNTSPVGHARRIDSARSMIDLAR